MVWYKKSTQIRIEAMRRGFHVTIVPNFLARRPGCGTTPLDARLAITTGQESILKVSDSFPSFIPQEFDLNLLGVWSEGRIQESDATREQLWDGHDPRRLRTQERFHISRMRRAEVKLHA